MSGVTQRMLKRRVDTTGDALGSVLWGAGSDGCLNGGTSMSVAVANNDPANSLTVTVQIQTLPGDDFVPVTPTYFCAADDTTRFAIPGLSAYAMRLVGVLSDPLATSTADVSVRVQP
jgi:hypothetical protein